MKDKVVIITGASSGIGKEAALLFARRKAKVVVAARREELLQELVTKIKEEGGEATAIVIDLAEENAPKTLIEKTIENYQQIDVLVNNAGFGQQMPIDQASEESARRIFQVNVLGVIGTVREAMPYLRKTKGVVINVASVAGFVPMPLHGLYTSTKHALIGLGKALPFEFKKAGVRIVTHCPGPVQTEFMDVMEGSHFPDWLLKWAGIFMDSPQTIARGIVKSAKKRRSAIVWGSFRSGMSYYSFCMFKPIANWLYSIYTGILLKQIQKEGK